MSLLVQYILIALKFIVPAFIPKFPFLATWMNYFLDTVDGDLLQHFGMNETTYQMVDKFADLISYIFMLIVGIRWSIKNVVVALFVYRIIGQILFFATGNEIYFVYFQNFLEPLMLIYSLILFRQGSEKKAFVVYKKYFFLIWMIIIGYKLWNEWYLHYANIDLSTIFFGINGAGL